jgi:hypothetical protein
MLSWEFLSMLSTFCAMSPWYSWRASPGSSRNVGALGDLETAVSWYNTSFSFYRKYTRTNVKDHLKKKMLKFYTDCPEAWGEILNIKGNTTPPLASIRKSRAGIAQEPSALPVPDFDE